MVSSFTPRRRAASDAVKYRLGSAFIDYLINLDARVGSGQRQSMSMIVRSILSVPGLRDRFLEKAVEVPADIILFDLEDSIPPARKLEARERVRAALPGFDRRGRLLFVRPNDLATGLLELDLDAVVVPGLDGIHLPKTHNPDVLRRTDNYLTLLERARGIALGSVRIIAWIESAEGVANVEAICRASRRLIGVSMGAED